MQLPFAQSFHGTSELTYSPKGAFNNSSSKTVCDTNQTLNIAGIYQQALVHCSLLFTSHRHSATCKMGSHSENECVRENFFLVVSYKLSVLARNCFIFFIGKYFKGKLSTQCCKVEKKYVQFIIMMNFSWHQSELHDGKP